MGSWRDGLQESRDSIEAALITARQDAHDSQWAAVSTDDLRKRSSP